MILYNCLSPLIMQGRILEHDFFLILTIKISMVNKSHEVINIISLNFISYLYDSEIQQYNYLNMSQY